jgi:predicted metal-dependent hydrolase
MPTERHYIQVSGIRVEVVRKAIRNLHLGVYPPEGRVRVAAPLRIDDEAVRLAVVSKLAWIRRQQACFARQERQSAREMVSGESHYVFGKRYRLRIIQKNAPFSVQLRGNSRLELHVRPGTDACRAEKLLYDWYREQLKARIPLLIEKWQPVIGAKVSHWGVKKMKTKWGSCNVDERRIWLNLELAKKPPQCLEYILVHEMVHLLEARHNERFRKLMYRFMPNWVLLRSQLNEAPLANEDWSY